MTKDDIEKLLGGYATGTLTAQERTLLFEAALADQALFNALADEQALKQLLDNPHARRRLLAALRTQASRPSWPGRLREWLRPLVAVRAVAGGAAVAILAVVTVTRLLEIVPPPSEVREGSYEADSAPGRAKSADKLAAKQKPAAAPKSDELRDRAAALEKAPREADMKQNKDAEQPPAASPQPETKRSERPPAAAAPEANRQTAAKADARADAGRFGKPGARDLFYGTAKKEQAPTAPGVARDTDVPAPEQPFAESRSSPGAASQEQVADATVQRLGLRYGMVPREEGPALVIEVNQPGYLYATARDAAGAATVLYPASATDLQAARVEPGSRYFIPPLGALTAARVTLVLSRAPLANPAAPPAPKPAEKKEAFLRQETSEPPLEGVGGPTVYVAEAVPSPSSSLSVEIVVPAR